MAKARRGGRVTPKGTQPAQFAPRKKAQLAAATRLQEQLTAAHDAVDATTFTGTAGGELVTVEITGDGDPQRLRIARSLIVDAADTGDHSDIEDLVIAALRAAQAQAAAAHDAATEATGLGGLDLGALGLGGMLAQ